MKLRKLLALTLALVMALAFAACGETTPAATQAPATQAPATQAPATQAPATQAPAATETPQEETTINVFVAASLEACFNDIIALYNETRPNVTVALNADSSGTLLTQIEEGYECDIFFSAAAKQMNTLADDGLMIEGSRVNLLQNVLSVITWKGSGTAVTGIENLNEAKSIALADASVPAGNYTRIALNKLGVLSDPAADTAAVSEALGGVEINECSNVSKVKEAVKEHSNEIGTVYYSDAYSIRNDIDVLELVDTSLTGEVIYPVARVVNEQATDAVTAAADDFMEFIQTPEVLAIYEEYMFVVADDSGTAEPLEAATINVFVAASLEACFNDIIALYNKSQPDVTVALNADSSGTLLTQIEEGYECDIFFSAAAKQMNTLEDDGLMIDGSRVDLLENVLSVITWKGSGTAVTGIENLSDAKSIALADASVPAGNYTRVALNKLGVLSDPAADTAAVSEALGGVEINECSNVSKVKEAVKEHSNEIGTVYYSDAYSIRNDIDVLELVDTSLTGEVIYPVARVVNEQATDAVTAAADDFMRFIQTPEVLAIYEEYMFTVHAN